MIGPSQLTVDELGPTKGTTAGGGRGIRHPLLGTRLATPTLGSFRAFVPPPASPHAAPAHACVEEAGPHELDWTQGQGRDRLHHPIHHA